MISIFIPSKDRPAQLLLLLESLEKNAPGMFYPFIMYNASNQFFANGYEVIKQNRAARKCLWVKEKDNAESLFYSFLEAEASLGGLIGLFSDDCIFYRKADINEKQLNHMFKNEDLFALTYRLGENIKIRDYVEQKPAYIPFFFRIKNKLFWNWEDCDFWDMFGFTVGFDGYIYRAKDLLSLSERSGFDNRICFWERMICRKFLEKKTTRKLMAAPIHSNVFVQQVNVTHEFGHRTNNTFHCSKEDLNQKILDGYKIDLDSMDFSQVNCTHGELSFIFKER